MQTFASKAIPFYKNLQFPNSIKIPKSVQILNPFNKAPHFYKIFFNRFFNNSQKRTFIFGINPGRFGSGITGIAFTDPVTLTEKLSISNDLPQKRELSATFITEVIESMGGFDSFYNHFYITSLSPLGFTKNGANFNFYDDKQLASNIKPFIIEKINVQLTFGANRNLAFCLGSAKLFKYFNELNNEHKFFEKIIPLEHPRFIMQYKLKEKKVFLKKYLKHLSLTQVYSAKL
ncbi:MAG: DUF4918 family protein [Chloroherpetonaceae bacterium]|nr:DUF4918 family protein [Chloroherpetonaceae bacterium]